jgi:uracil-DNA glycosylase
MGGSLRRTSAGAGHRARCPSGIPAERTSAWVGPTRRADGLSQRLTTIRLRMSSELVRSPSERREALKEVLAQARGCTRCTELAATRKTVVFGAGNADAEVMFVGEAPGASEDEQGLPFVGRAGKLLDQLLGEIAMNRNDVFVCNTLKCRPPGNRDPLPVEIENCQDYLLRQVELIQPTVICTLGNFSTKLLRGDPTGITRLHGQPEVRVLGRRAVRLYPIYHPAAALYTPRMLETLREDFARIPELVALGAPEQPSAESTAIAEAAGLADRPDDPAIRAHHPAIRPDELAIGPDDPAVGPDDPAVRPDDPAVRPDQLGLF